MDDIEHLAKNFEEFKEERRQYSRETNKILLELSKRIEHLDETNRRIDRIDKQIEDIYARIWKIALIITTVSTGAGVVLEKIF